MRFSLLAQVLRILSRKPANRQKVAEGDVAAIVRHLTGASRAVAAECANVILNLCFERANVSRLLKCNGVAPLVSLLKSPDTDVQASTCGVIQSICYLVRIPIHRYYHIKMHPRSSLAGRFLIQGLKSVPSQKGKRPPLHCLQGSLMLLGRRARDCRTDGGPWCAGF